MSASTARAPQKWLKEPWGRAAKTQMVKGKMEPSPRLRKWRSNEVVLVVFPVCWPIRRVFWNINLSIRSKKMISTPQVDVEKLKRQLRRELLGDLKPILES
jgi:hypothetical protein